MHLFTRSTAVTVLRYMHQHIILQCRTISKIVLDTNFSNYSMTDILAEYA